MKDIQGKYFRDTDGTIRSPFANIATVFWDEATDYDTYIKNYLKSKGFLDELKASLFGADFFDMMMPVGYIYTSLYSTDPETLFGGKWNRLTSTFLYGAGTSDPVDASATTAKFGEANVTLNSNQMPAHGHGITFTGGGSHSHQITLPIRGIPDNSSTDDQPLDFNSISAGPVHSLFPDKGVTTIRNVSYNTGSSGGTPSATIAMTGGGQSHNNMPPYMRVYMWKKIKKAADV